MTEMELVIDMRDLVADISEKVNNGQSVLLKGEGVSMTPFITCEDTLTLNKPVCRKPKTGDIYLYKRCDGRYAIHRVYAVKKDGVRMLGDAQLLIETVPSDSLVAIVTAVEGPTRRIDCTDNRVRRRCVLHMKRRVYSADFRRVVRRFFGRAKRAPAKIWKILTKER